MKTFKLNDKGDVSITDNKIDMVSGVEVIMQTLRQVINTNLNEWFTDKEEGIDYSVILTKNPNTDLIHDTIETAVNKVAEQLGVEVETDNYTFTTTGRQMDITFDIKLSGDTETMSLSI